MFEKDVNTVAMSEKSCKNVPHPPKTAPYAYDPSDTPYPPRPFPTAFALALRNFHAARSTHVMLGRLVRGPIACVEC